MDPWRPEEGWPALLPTKTERLIALLHAQRSEAARRAREVRGSPSWIDSSNRLDALNDRIMHDGPVDPPPDDRARNDPGSARPRAN
jgi:hypothetical protein